jgi:hypothetical protein
MDAGLRLRVSASARVGWTPLAGRGRLVLAEVAEVNCRVAEDSGFGERLFGGRISIFLKETALQNVDVSCLQGSERMTP